MSAVFSNLAASWGYNLHEMLGIIFVLGVVGAYSTLFAFTRRPWLGWAITAAITLVSMAILIMISPRVDPVPGDKPTALSPDPRAVHDPIASDVLI